MPLDFVSSVLLSTVLTGALSALAYRRDVLTWDGSLAAFVVGMVIGVFGDVTWLFLLLFFLLSSFLATRYRFALKEALGVQEGLRGERKATNVLANGFAPMAVAAISLTMPAGFPKIISGVIFLSALSVAGADTLASEIGVLSRKTVLITTREPVPPGTDGGVSRLGQLCAFGAAAYTSFASASARSGVRPSAYTRKIGSVPDGRTRTAPSGSTIFTPSVVSTFRPFVSSTKDERTASRRSTGTETFVFFR